MHQELAARSMIVILRFDVMLFICQVELSMHLVWTDRHRAIWACILTCQLIASFDQGNIT